MKLHDFYSSFINKIPKLEAIKNLLTGERNKKNYVFPQWNALSIAKWHGNNRVNDIDEPHLYSEWNKLNTEQCTLYISIYMNF